MQTFSLNELLTPIHYLHSPLWSTALHMMNTLSLVLAMLYTSTTKQSRKIYLYIHHRPNNLFLSVYGLQSCLYSIYSQNWFRIFLRIYTTRHIIYPSNYPSS